jgi:GT2 family glycosyltransferase
MANEFGNKPPVAVSIVSHGQGALVEPLLKQLARIALENPLEIILTENLPHGRAKLPTSPAYSNLIVLENPFPLGFGANHNRAFLQTTAPYFVVMNPDIEVEASALDKLVACLRQFPGVAAPRVLSPIGAIEDSARKVPDVWRLLKRKLTGRHTPDYDMRLPLQQVDWLAGMCLAFDRESFAHVGGFDERYHLYCEDVDICLRMHLAERCVSWVQESVVKHDARRASHRRLRYFTWHLASLCRLFRSGAYWRFRRSSWGPR